MSVPRILEEIQKNDFSNIFFTDGKLRWSYGYSYSLNEVLGNVTFLSWAVRKSNLDTIKRLILYGSKINQRETGGATPLLIAIYLNRLDAVKLLIDNGADINMEDSFGTPLTAAVREGNIDIIQYLLERGADAETCDIQGLSPFFRTILESKIPALELFLRKGYISKVDDSKNTPLIAAIRYKSSPETIKCLLKHNVNINESKNKKFPLAWAAAKGNLEAVEILLNEGADANMLSQDGDTALISAIKHRQLEVAKYLLHNQVNSCKADENGKTPLFWAVSNQDIEMTKLLLSHGAEYTIDTVFLDAVETQNLKIIQLLKENGASVRTRTDNTTPLMKCLATGNVEIARYLIENGSKVVEDLNGEEIMKCMEKKNFDMVKLLTENGARLNQPTHSGHTLLTKSIQMQNFDMVTYFLSRGAINNATSLMIAVDTGNVAMVKLLLDKGAALQNLEKAASKLIELIEKKKFEMVKLLTEQGAQLDQADDLGQTPLTKAVQVENFELVKYFISKGANVNQANGSGLTPLVIAQSKNDFKSFQYLVDSGASVSEKDQGKNPQLARCYRIAKEKSAKQGKIQQEFGSNQEDAKEK